MKSLKFKILIFVVAVIVFTVCMNIAIESGALYDAYRDADVTETDGSVYYLDNRVVLDKPLYFVNGRLFIPFEDFIAKIGGNVTTSFNSYEVNCDSVSFSLEMADDEKLLRPLFYKEDCCYISLYDISNLLNLAVTFDCKTNKVFFYRRDAITEPPEKSEDVESAYLRLEDVGAKMNDNGEELEKFRVMVDYLYSKGQNFYVAWIPLFVDPANGIYNDLTENFNFYNADFIYTLDYVVAHGGNIVLHGYTHQENDTTSGIGTEFGPNSPYTLTQLNERMQAAKSTAAKLGFDNSIFEFPHYSTTANQLKLAENNFDIIYQQDMSSKKGLGRIVSKHAFPYLVKYVPTPIGYIHGEGALPDTLAAIDALPQEQITSMFMHPYLDFAHIRCTTENGKRTFYYDDNSILSQLVGKITQKGMAFSNIE